MFDVLFLIFFVFSNTDLIFSVQYQRLKAPYYVANLICAVVFKIDSQGAIFLQ